jgi:hypothetical protein
MYYWQIDDGRIWSADAAAFVASTPEGEIITPLYDSGQPGGIEYLRDTIKFYGCALGELAGPEERRAAILARLTEIDTASVRPLRAIAQGDAVQADHDRLAALDAEASGLREELTALQGS